MGSLPHLQSDGVAKKVEYEVGGIFTDLITKGRIYEEKPESNRDNGTI